jgi:hypothetical protein
MPKFKFQQFDVDDVEVLGQNKRNALKGKTTFPPGMPTKLTQERYSHPNSSHSEPPEKGYIQKQFSAVQRKKNNEGMQDGHRTTGPVHETQDQRGKKSTPSTKTKFKNSSHMQHRPDR